MTRKIIIVEGCDGSGKSTYVSELAELMPDDTRIIHKSQPRKTALREYLYPLSQRQTDEDIIADRWHLGELIYGPLYRGQSRLSKAQYAYIEMYLEAQGATRLIMDTPLQTIRRRLARRGEDFLKDDHVSMVVDFYDDILRNGHGWLSASKMRPQIVATWPQQTLGSGYVGCSSPEVLYVVPTIRPVVVDGSIVQLPTVPETGTEGEFFMESLLRSGLPVKNVGILKHGSRVEAFVVANAKRIVMVGEDIPHPVKANMTVHKYAEELSRVSSR